MKETLYFWTGMPSSPSQLTQLLARLEKGFPPSKGRTQVVFENEVMPIADLAAGFDGEAIGDEIVARASALGILEAAALIGVRGATSVPPASNVDSLTYLGGIEVSEDN